MCRHTRNVTLVFRCSKCTYTQFEEKTHRKTDRIDIQLKTKTTQLNKENRQRTILYIQVDERIDAYINIYKKQQ